jgi:hypothetical protein
MPKLTQEYIERMEDVLDLYAKPYDPKEPVLCIDEKSKQLLVDTRPHQATTKGTVRKRDYEYKRNGTRNIFVCVEPKGGHREVTVTNRRTKRDFAEEIKRIIEAPRYRNATTIHLVLDNLNTHFPPSFVETFGEQKAAHILSRIHFHYTPKHASWLDAAEIEIGILSRQSICGRIASEEKLRTRINAWQQARNAVEAKINWRFTKKDARNVFKYKDGKLS